MYTLGAAQAMTSFVYDLRTPVFQDTLHFSGT